MTKITRIIIITSLFMAVIPISCQAFSFDELFDELEKWFSTESNSSQIINEINVSTETGNTTINGEVKEGETKSQIYVKNIINGEEIEPIDIESEANEVKVESEIDVEDGKAFVQREIEIDSEKSVEDYEVDLESPEAETEDLNEEALEETLDTIQEWWSDLVEELKSFLENIFNIF